MLGGRASATGVLSLVQGLRQPAGALVVRGADDEIRTRDIDLGKVALYQLSYIRLRVSRRERRER